MKEISGTLVKELRRKLSGGASVPDLLRLLHERLGREAVYGTTLAKYFMAAFDLPLRVVSPIGGWAPNSTSEISDARIQELIYPEIMQKKSLWHSPNLANQLDVPATAPVAAVEARPEAIEKRPK
jgi:hypothetical protein